MRETGFEAVRGLMERWYGESMSAGRGARPRRRRRRHRGARPARASSSPSATASPPPAARCSADGGVGQVEEVYTAAAHRGHGLASAVVRAAIAAAHERGDDLVMIMADADDWPQKLYERLGFETVDAYRPFTRKPPANVAEGKFDEVNLPGRRNPYRLRRPPGVVRRLAQIARERGVGRRPGRPRRRAAPGASA